MKSLKIIISLLAVVCILSTSIFSLSSITASATTVPDIRLHSSEFVIKAARGLYTRDIYIKVRDTEKYGRTFVHYETAPGKAWADVEAEKTTLQSKEGYSIYKATICTNSRNTKFALKYDFVASALWDNNYYQDFTDLTLGYNENIKAERTNRTNSNYYDVSAILRNISYAKEVKCVYSEDNFKTKKTINLNYKEFVNGTSYGSQMERWTGRITGIKNTNNLKFYLTYKTLADGKTYTDNYFNQNYNYTIVNEPY